MATAVKISAPKAAAAWPGLSGNASAAARTLMNGKVPNPSAWFARRKSFFHRIDYATGGQTSLQLFNVAPSNNVCNLPVQGSLGAETFFRLDSVHVIVQSGITAAATYTRAANGAQILRGASGASVVTNTEEIRTILEGGSLTIKIGDKNVIDNEYDLTRFPGYNGFKVNSAAATTTSTMEVVSALFNNGCDNPDNCWKLKPYFPVLPQKTIRGELNWQAALAVTTAFVLRVELQGVLLTPSNL